MTPNDAFEFFVELVSSSMPTSSSPTRPSASTLSKPKTPGCEGHPMESLGRPPERPPYIQVMAMWERRIRHLRVPRPGWDPAGEQAIMGATLGCYERVGSRRSRPDRLCRFGASRPSAHPGRLSRAGCAPRRPPLSAERAAVREAVEWWSPPAWPVERWWPLMPGSVRPAARRWRSLAWLVVGRRSGAIASALAAAGPSTRLRQPRPLQRYHRPGSASRSRCSSPMWRDPWSWPKDRIPRTGWR